MGETNGKSSPFLSATVLAAAIGGASAVLSTVLPWWLERQKVTATPVAERSPSVAATITPLPAAQPGVLPNFSLGVWTIVESIDEEGTDFRGSTIKFNTQRETSGGLELTGFFEWRNNNSIIVGREYFLAHYDSASRQLFIEGQYVESPLNQLAVGSFSARVAEDGRQLLEGTWGNSPNHQAGVPGRWAARR
jgi:hypothetical protein